MTLCVVWKIDNNIYFASDSRISNGDDEFSDYGIKISPILVKIYGPSEENSSAKVVFEKNYALCFSGSFLGAFTIKEFLRIALQKLQYIPDFMELSFENICHIVNKFYSKIIVTISQELNSEHSIEFYFSGYCPKEKKLMLAKFYIDYGESLNKMDGKYVFIKDDEFVNFIGSGYDKYGKELEKIKSTSKLNKPLIALKNLIDKKLVPSVGGNIQVGNFDGDNFSISGIVKRVYEEKGLFDKFQYCYAGVDMNSQEFSLNDTEYFIMGSYIDPFKSVE